MQCYIAVCRYSLSCNGGEIYCCNLPEFSIAELPREGCNRDIGMSSATFAQIRIVYHEYEYS
ncbi:hypothetical protein HYPBUDRAFT_174939 [Hyphopichia burtonii NRRL Y-1933]|uniref:Uncharacterized protein n=1 Tax=Hyphopichia burtonii NRRL Y-1933 TaxID=984485 RepID=A0A1E4RRI7_9ASCO|nr:hypothetical protein HYPBUDRAFT_174939 [Hyphopichia burtonii NRRL Y-1933]ODV69867.1 hypothetical protein HYPBUDRAFT_174939 [Hyphopichia burtonii NRRL Y-1933]